MQHGVPRVSGAATGDRQKQQKQIEAYKQLENDVRIRVWLSISHVQP